MEKLNCQFDQEDRMSMNSVPSSAWSSANEESDQDDGCVERPKRYASVRRTIRTRNSSIKKISQNLQDQKLTKLDQLEQLKCELNQIKQELVKAKQNSSDVEKMKSQLRKIDNLILIKSSLISSLEKELQRLSSINPTKYCLSSTNSASSISSTDTGISSAQSEDETCFETLSSKEWFGYDSLNNIITTA
ncbi:hypothetical protein BpHYR1_020503 [Brachionus plicatilis]|uniref:Uncharacterized protein n=1 Tax=Brachionus plicatilis TaxID=10195 RepID=A0A3M7QCJ4_BRAPC|nr:hypothetical protein BpHYR1_020503 [Brachionus plicatilis]